MWIGTKRVAFLPLRRAHAVPPDNPSPSDWPAAIRRRVLDDPDASGRDQSLRAYLQACSSWRADIDPTVLPERTIDRQDVPPDVFEAELGDQLRGQGFDACALVMLGGPGAGTAQRGGFWARFVMAEGLGTWAMELMHVLTGFDDLYPFGGNLGLFDEMASNGGSHPTAYTKAAIGWLDRKAIATAGGPIVSHRLHAVSLSQPPPPGAVTAVRVGGPSAPYVMIEARRRTDQFDERIPAEGVIAYRVQTNDPLGHTQNSQAPVTLLTLTADGHPTAVAVGTSVDLDGRIGLTVDADTPDGYTVTVEDFARHLYDRTGQYGAPKAASDPTGLWVPASGVQNYGYRDGSGHLRELWRDASGGTGTTDLTANAGAPKAAGTPFFACRPTTPQVMLLFRDTDGGVRSLWWDSGAVGMDDLSGTAGAPPALDGPAGDPVAWFHEALDTWHVVYAMRNGHLQELFWAGDDPVAGGGDLTASAGAPPAAGRAAPMVDDSGTHVVVYRAADGVIHDLYWTASGVGVEDLSGYAGRPPAAYDPAAYWTAHDNGHEVVYVDAVGQVQELWWAGTAPVQGRALTTGISPAYTAVGTPAAYYSPQTGARHAAFRSVHGGLHLLTWTEQDGPVDLLDLTGQYGLPAAAGDPAVVVVPGTRRQYLAYRGADGHIYEVTW